jgi:prolyl-tRNA synthetase
VQCIVLAVRDEVRAEAQRLVDDLLATGVRAKLDDRTNLGFGRRITDWEIKGVPVRIEMGPRDLATGEVTVVRRDTGVKEARGLATVADGIAPLLDDIQATLHAEALTRCREATADVGDAKDIDGPGFFRIPWGGLGEDGEAALAERAYTVRCLVTDDGDVPGPAGEHDGALMAYVAKAY